MGVLGIIEFGFEFDFELDCELKNFWVGLRVEIRVGVLDRVVRSFFAKSISDNVILAFSVWYTCNACKHAFRCCYCSCALAFVFSQDKAVDVLALLVKTRIFQFGVTTTCSSGIKPVLTWITDGNNQTYAKIKFIYQQATSVGGGGGGGGVRGPHWYHPRGRRGEGSTWKGRECSLSRLQM